MRKFLIITLSAILFYACTLTNHTENDESNEISTSIELKSADTEDTPPGLKITSALNLLHNIKVEEFDVVALNGMWIVIENEKDVPQSIDLDIQINNEDKGIQINNDRLTVYIPSGSKTLFMPEVVDDSFTDYNQSTFVVEGNTPIENAEKCTVQLDIQIKDSVVTRQNITLKR